MNKIDGKFWDERYASEELRSTAKNQMNFLKTQIDALKPW